MEKKNNIIRLTEKEFNTLVESAVIEAINEGGWGKKLGKAALYGALGAGSLYCLDKGLENQEKYQQEINAQGREIGGPSDEKIAGWAGEHGMRNTEDSHDAAWDYFHDKAQNESKEFDKLSRIIREAISKVL